MARATDAPARGPGPTIFISAGEPSGDLHGAALARALSMALPGVRLIGLGGDRMRAAGVELLAEVEELAVIGLAEVLRHLPFFVRLRRRVFEALEREGVELVIPIDYPGFNLRLARGSRRRGIPVLYYIAPQVWAWHSSRTRAIARDTDRVAVVLPFEEEYLRRAGVEATFVGHPLLDRALPSLSREKWCAEHDLDPSAPILALFPGSRAQEVERHLSLMLETAELLRRRRPEVQPVIAAVPDLPPSLFASAPWPLEARGELLLAHARLAVVKSGTTTLETALAGVPMVVVYRMHPLSYMLARRLVRTPFVSLANLVAGGEVVPERLQDAARPAELARLLEERLDDGAVREATLAGLARVRGRLGEPRAAERVAAIALELLEARRVAR
jgi:lipid-A-disaccharide synthase